MFWGGLKRGRISIKTDVIFLLSFQCRVTFDIAISKGNFN